MSGKILRKAIISGTLSVSEMTKEQCLLMLVHDWPEAEAEKFKPEISIRLRQLEAAENTQGSSCDDCSLNMSCMFSAEEVKACHEAQRNTEETP